MKDKLQTLRDDIQCFRVDEHYSASDLLSILNLLERIVTVLQSHDSSISRVSNEIGEHLNS